MSDVQRDQWAVRESVNGREMGARLSRVARAAFLAIALVGFAPGHEARAQAAVLGHWEGPYDFIVPPPVNDEITALALLPTGPEAGKVIFWRKNASGTSGTCQRG